MTPFAPETRDWTRRLWLALIMLAVCLKVLAPSGYMLASPTEDRPFPLVLCTAQGLVALEADSDAPADEDPHAPAPADEAGETCAFAASPAATPAPADPIWAPIVFARAIAPQRPSLTHLAPGRGLAAPPPARAPPLQLT